MDYNELFVFTKQERRGILVFIFLVFVILTLAEYWPDPTFEDSAIDLTKYNFPPEEIVKSKTKDISYHQNYNDESYDDAQKKSKKPHQKFNFDPNLLSADSLLLLGFSTYGVHNIIKYREKGGKIKDIDKFKTIYGIDTSIINELGDLIKFEAGKYVLKITNDSTTVVKKTPFKTMTAIEMNTADSTQWEQLSGIGPYTVTKILKYRERLGGFIDQTQLVELGIIRDSLYQILQPYLDINTNIINKININTADYKVFTKHPYFTPDIANKIIKYRMQHGSFVDVAHISRIKSLNEAQGRSLLPYLKVE